MFWNKIFHNNKSLHWLYEEIYANNLIDFRVSGGLLGYGISLNPLVQRLVERPDYSPKALDAWIIAGHMGIGPRLFTLDFDDIEVEALQQIQCRLRISELELPFPAFYIVFPKPIDHIGMLGIRHVQLPNDGSVSDAAANMLAVSCYLDDEERSVLTTAMWGEDYVEDLICENKERTIQFSDPMSTEENALLEKMIRLAVNATMMFVHFGWKSLGRYNVSYCEKLRRAGKYEELHRQPTMYGWKDKKPTIYHAEMNGHPGGHVMSSHWRIGHYRQQVHGPMNTLRKRIFIHPTLVIGRD